jgi:hypothetical protein
MSRGVGGRAVRRHQQRQGARSHPHHSARVGGGDAHIARGGDSGWVGG